MYSNPNQYSGQGYQSSYPQYQQNYNSGYNYDGYNQNQYTAVQPVPPGEEYPQNSWAPVAAGTSTPATNATFTNTHHTTGYEKNEDEAVAQERKQQNAQLIKQREEYVRKAKVLRRELELLRNQKHEILSENSTQRDMELILKENDKLQEEIQSKMKAIHNVIEMLSSIIKDGSKISDLEAQLDESPPKNHHKSHSHKSIDQHSTTLTTTTPTVDNNGIKYNYMHYDPELHWCRMCDEFPKTAKDFLLHLQSEKHKNNIQENDVGDNTPWHKLQPEPELPCYEGAPKKRIPIRGLQFFISAPAWYCKLCDTWIGDLHCASHHLKSQSHFQNYANFVEQNPHWEIEWLKDREKALTRNERRSSDSDEVTDKKKRKHHRNKRSSIESSNKEKKKKKRSKKRRKHSSDTSSSSSSSDSSSDDDETNDKSKSIRVVMRNMKVQSIMNEDLSGKWEMLERLVDEHKKKEEQRQKAEAQKLRNNDDSMMSQWMTISEPQDKEKVLLDNLKDRMKQKQEIERAKYAELERKQREKEREEHELNERKVREEKEAKERFERERRERDRQEYERIRDKDRNQVKFKPKERDSYRKRRSPTPDKHSDSRRYSRSDSRDRRSHENGRASTERRRSRSRGSRSRSRSNDRKYRDDSDRKKPPGPPSSKRLPFIGRMPLFKNKKPEEKVEKEIKKEDYDIPRQTRFQPGNLARAFLPQPDVVCFPKLSSYPPISAPPPPPVVSQPDPPEPPKISEDKPRKAPPAPKIGKTESTSKKEEKQKQLQQQQQQQQEQVKTEEQNNAYDANQQMMMNQYYSGMDYNMMYSQMYDYSQCQDDVQTQPPPPPPPPPPPEDVPLSHTMPLQPPPLPPNDPNDDLAMLGISADDMAAQTF